MAAELWWVRSGVVPYEEARRTQKLLERSRHAGDIPDLLLLLEHHPVYTKGRRTTDAELPMGEDWYRMQGIEVCETDRGGRVTYHGPGQLVGYPIVDLRSSSNRARGREAERAARVDVVDYIRRMERVMIASLGDYGVEASVIEGLTGVWARSAGSASSDRATPGREAEEVARGDIRKIGSIGIHVNRGITTHGFAINVNNDLQPFEWIVPCGIDACRMTSLTRELGAEQDLDAFAEVVSSRFAELYERRAVGLEASELVERVPGAAALADEAVPVR